MRISRNKQGLFVSFLLSYLLILLLPIIIGSLVYKEALRLVEEDAEELNMSILKQSRDILDHQLANISSTATQIAYLSKVRNMLTMDENIKIKTPHIITETWKEVQYYNLTNKFINNIYIYFSNPDVIIDSNTSYIDMSRFYDSFFKFGDMDYEQWKNEILNKHHQKNILPALYIQTQDISDINVNAPKKKMIAYLQTIPIEFPSQTQGLIKVLIEEEEVKNLFEHLYIDHGGWAYIADENGKFITSISNSNKTIDTVHHGFVNNEGSLEKIIDDEKMTITYTVSSQTGWMFVAAVPTSVLMSKVIYIKQITAIVTIGVLLSGLLIAYLMAYRNIKPVKRIIDTLKNSLNTNQEIDGNAYDYIQGNLVQLIHNNEFLKESVQKQKPFIRTAFFDRFFKGGFNTLKEIKVLLAHIGIDIYGNLFIVFIINLNECKDMISKNILEELDMKRVVIRDILNKITKKGLYVHNIEEDRLAVFMQSNTSNENEFKDYVMSTIEELSIISLQNYGITPQVAVGGIYNGLLNVQRSFEEAQQALNFAKFKNSNELIWFCDVPKSSNIYYYPMEIETRLTNLTKAGEKKEVKKVLGEIYEENFETRKLSADMLEYLLLDMRCSLIKLVQQINMDDEKSMEKIKKLMQKLNGFKTLDLLFNNIIRTYTAICDMVWKQKESHNIQLKNDIIDYINCSYMDSNLSLTMIAQAFDLNETYVSRFFKEQTGENFSTYLERIRLEKSKELLKNGNKMSVEQIAECTGYNSANVFRRAFKRYEGVSPSVFQKG